MVEKGDTVEEPEAELPAVPLDFIWAKKRGLVRKLSNFICSIADDRGDELKCCGVVMPDVFKHDLLVGGVLSPLRFWRHLPIQCTKFIEMILMVPADRGPAVIGAHNTSDGKDLVSPLCSGLLTIGPRFGGALDDAARKFAEAESTGLKPKDFIDNMKRSNKLIMGIGHRIGSWENPDKRVVIIKEYAKAKFSSTAILDFASGVGPVTARMRTNLILNVDGCIAVPHRPAEVVRRFPRLRGAGFHDVGCLNGLFVLGRSLIGPLCLKQPLQRHPRDDTSYIDKLAGDAEST